MCSNKRVHFADDLSERLAFGNYNADEAKRVYFNDNVPLRPFAESQLPAAVAPVPCKCTRFYKCAQHRGQINLKSFRKMFLRILVIAVLIAVAFLAYNRFKQSSPAPEALPVALTATPATEVPASGISLNDFIRRLQ